MESIVATPPNSKPLDTGLLTIENGESRVSTLLVAEGTRNDHASVIKLVRVYLQQFEKFGLVRFEIRPRPQGQHGGGNVEFALLNEPQATFLFTLMRNNEVVIDFKVRLVQAFQVLRAQVQRFDPRKLSRLDLIQLAMDAEKERLTLAAENGILKPKAAFHDQVHCTEDAITIQAFAKLCGTGMTRMFRWLRKAGYIIPSNNLPYQKHIDSGFFRVIEEAFQDKHGRDRVFMKTLVTGKGQIALAKRFRAQGEDQRLHGLGA